MTKLLVIDEVSFLHEDIVVKLDRNMRKLKENDHELYREVLVIFVGDFCQMLLVKGSPLFKTNTIQFSSINRDLFLNVPHRFREDKDYGEIMRRHRAGNLTKDDTEKIILDSLKILMRHFCKL